MLPAIAAIATLGSFLFLNAGRDAAGHDSSHDRYGESDWRKGQVLAPGRVRCGVDVARPGIDREHDTDLPFEPLPNAYMIVNGRLFTLVDALACSRHLHAARVN